MICAGLQYLVAEKHDRYGLVASVISSPPCKILFQEPYLRVHKIILTYVTFRGLMQLRD